MTARSENMLVAIEGRRHELVCRRRGVRRLELFGSAVREDFGPRSDLDFIVEFGTTRRWAITWVCARSLRPYLPGR
jgi:hypothetical protein